MASSDNSLKVEFRLNPVELVIPAVLTPQFLGDRRHEDVCQVDLVRWIRDRADDDSHGHSPNPT